MFTRNFLTAASLVFVLVGCGRNGDQSASVQQIVGGDDRIPAGQSYSDVVGSLSFGDYHVCTAYFSAPNVISTANHCAPATENLERYSFKTQSGKTFALKNLVKNLSTRNAAFETVVQSSKFLESAPFDNQRPVNIVSYSAKSNRYLESAIGKAKMTVQGLLHTLDTEPGSSGAPVLQGGRVVAVHEGGLIDSPQNYATRIVPDSQKADEYTGLVNQEWRCESRCEWYQPDCYAYKELNCNTGVLTICKHNLAVPMIAYYACQLALGAIPVTCTAGAALTAGTACYSNMGIAAAACSLSISQIYEVGKACVENL
jgi:V8-like Glu-specific endopeptidase